jgi:hypothetical protein
MIILVRIVRYAAASVAGLGFVFALFSLWSGVADYQMQIAHHWKYRCLDIQIMAAFVACLSGGLAVVSLFAYGRSIAWERSLHSTQKV